MTLRTYFRTQGVRSSAGLREIQGLTFSLKAMISWGVIVSAFAITGIKFTLVPNRFIVSISNGFKLRHAKHPKESVSKIFQEMARRKMGTHECPFGVMK